MSILQVFMNVWNADPQSRPTLQKLLAFWKGYFPDSILGSIRTRLSAQQVSTVFHMSSSTMSCCFPQLPIKLT